MHDSEFRAAVAASLATIVERLDSISGQLGTYLGTIDERLSWIESNTRDLRDGLLAVGDIESSREDPAE